ncbi:hypothetical protein [Microbacterium maritypicum]|uniref:hypothetical protein n=1 Tax=Microbacterium maritypicum TaxID=33918 RepID=UPI00296FBB3E|nr:hypothetical protein [Microbacterium liquefaciens]
MSEIDKALPALPQRVAPARKTAQKPAPTRVTTVSPRSVPSDGSTVSEDAPGRRMERELPAGDLLVALYDAEEVGRHAVGDYSLQLPDPATGTYNGGTNARVFRDADGIDRVMVTGSNRMAELGVDTNEPKSSFYFLADVLCDGDFRKALTFAKFYSPTHNGLGWETLIGDLVDHERDVDAVITTREIVAPVSEVDTHMLKPKHRADGTEITALNATLSEAIEHRIEREFTVRKDVHAVVAGAKIGVWKDGAQITDWVVWRCEAHDFVSIDQDGATNFSTASMLYRLMLVDRFGNRHLSRKLYSAKDAHNVSTVDELDAGVTMPEYRDHERALWDAQRALGRHDGSQQRFDVYTSMGWLVRDGKPPVFLMPNGSYDHSTGAITNEYRVDLAPSQPGAGLGNLDRKVGLSRLSTSRKERQTALDALFSLIGIAGEEAGVALIGTQFAPLTGQAMNASLDLYGIAGSGKSWVAAAGQSFFTSYPLTGKAFMISIPHSKKVGSEIKASFFRNLCVYADDMRINSNPIESNNARSLATSLIQLAYGAEGVAKGASSSSLADVRSVTSGLVLTSEYLIQETAVMRRIIGVEVTDYNMEAMRVFKRTHFRDGTNRRFTADYIASLAQRMVELGGLAELAEEATTRAEDWTTAHGGARSGVDVVGVVAATWEYLFDYIDEHDLTPAYSREEIADILHDIAEDNASAVDGVDAGKTIIEFLRGMLENSTGYLKPWHDKPPVSEHAALYGYQQGQSDSGRAGYYPPSNAKVLGYVSKDGKNVVIAANTILSIRSAAGVGDMPAEQVYRLLRKHAVATAGIPGKQQSQKLGLINADTRSPLRPKGITLSATEFGREFPAETPVPAPRKNDDSF